MRDAAPEAQGEGLELGAEEAQRAEAQAGRVGGRSWLDVRLWAPQPERGLGSGWRRWGPRRPSPRAAALAGFEDAWPREDSSCRPHVGCPAWSGAESAEAEDKMGAAPPSSSLSGARAAAGPHVAHAPPRTSRG